MRDERGVDYGMVTGIGVAIASAIILLAVFAAFRSAAPAGETMALQSASSCIAGDIDTVSMMGIPYAREESYGFNGMDVYIGPDHVRAVTAGSSFVKPLSVRVYPGRYEEEGAIIWNDTCGFRQYLNVTLGATGSEDSPLRSESMDGLHALLERSLRSMAASPVHVVPGRLLSVEKLYVYHDTDTAGGPSREACVFVHCR